MIVKKKRKIWRKNNLDRLAGSFRLPADKRGKASLHLNLAFLDDAFQRKTWTRSQGLRLDAVDSSMCIRAAILTVSSL